jgi:hypothetical protein
LPRIGYRSDCSDSSFSFLNSLRTIKTRKISGNLLITNLLNQYIFKQLLSGDKRGHLVNYPYYHSKSVWGE